MASPAFLASAPEAKRAKYEAEDLAAKVQMLKVLQAGASRKEVMEKFNVKKSTLSSYVKNEEQIMQAYDGDMFGDKRKKLRTAVHPKLEEALLHWIAVSRDAQLPLSGPIVSCVTTAVQGHLGIHCRDCGCKREFEKCAVVAKHREHLTCEIIEANQIQQLGDICVSMLSVALTKKEIAYLALTQ